MWAAQMNNPALTAFKPGGTFSPAEIPSLIQLALTGIRPMLNRQEGIFCFRLRRTPTGLAQEGLSLRYTMMTLIGLQQCRIHGLDVPVDVDEILDRLLSDLKWIDNPGDLGLLFWTCAAISPHRLSQLLGRVDPERALEKSSVASRRSTMELAWYLTGMAHASVASPELKRLLKNGAFRVFEWLKANQGNHGFFGHSARQGSVSSILRGHIGSFADQVYPICAFAKFGSAYDHDAAIEAAAGCAQTICNAQGSLGQWWWHYDAGRGEVFERYPVYSVHQHGMAPMALFAIQEVAPVDFSENIYRGLNWITGANELGLDMRDDSAGLAWRNIYSRSDGPRYLSWTRSFLGRHHGSRTPGNLDVTWECRPYELGWLLYAFAGRGTTGGPEV
ncbi:MAG TPA: hypothetical protein VG672_27135 [Bryobacteraceae bacterium]|nr:hypothetical protein [Bryobacteraceae bacterium]